MQALVKSKAKAGLWLEDVAKPAIVHVDAATVRVALASVGIGEQSA